MNKDFNDFLNTIDDKQIIREASNYMTTAIVTDEKAKKNNNKHSVMLKC